MGILLQGIKEVWHNFTNPIEDNNEPVAEISGDNFVAIARQSGLSQEAINELVRNRMGVNLPVRRRANNIKSVDDKKDAPAKKSLTPKRENKEIERD